MDLHPPLYTIILVSGRDLKIEYRYYVRLEDGCVIAVDVEVLSKALDDVGVPMLRLYRYGSCR